MGSTRLLLLALLLLLLLRDEARQRPVDAAAARLQLLHTRCALEPHVDEPRKGGGLLRLGLPALTPRGRRLLPAPGFQLLPCRQRCRGRPACRLLPGAIGLCRASQETAFNRGFSIG
jgi:hypothetical protein